MKSISLNVVDITLNSNIVAKNYNKFQSMTGLMASTINAAYEGMMSV